MCEIIKDMIEKNLNEKGKLDCSVAFKISAKTKSSIADVSKAANDMGIRIDNCELGQFGSLEMSESSDDLYDKIKPFLDEKNRIFCKDGRNLSAGVGLRKMRSTLKNFKVDVKYCELGCFKEKKGKSMKIKTKIWIENADGELLFGKGKTEVLKLINETGSIKQASKVLGMNYKKCWSHLKILEENFKDELFVKKQGRGEDAGTMVKPKAFELMSAYEELEKDIEEFANKRFKELFLKKD